MTIRLGGAGKIIGGGSGTFTWTLTPAMETHGVKIISANNNVFKINFFIRSPPF